MVSRERVMISATTSSQEKIILYGNMRSVLGSMVATTSYTSTTTVYADVDTIVP